MVSDNILWASSHFTQKKGKRFGLYRKLVYICAVVKADCAAVLSHKFELNT